jgi:hypothetical protein
MPTTRAAFAPPADWSLERRREYFDWAKKVVDGLPQVSAELRSAFDASVRGAPLTAAQLLAVVEVDPADRVVCQSQGCGHAVYKRIHVAHLDGRLMVCGSDCFSKLFGGNPAMARPRYGSGDGRLLTDAERTLLAENTARLIEQFEAERLAQLEREAELAARREREEREAAARAAERQAAIE